MPEDSSTRKGQRDYRPFGVVLRDLLIEREITTKLGNPDWTAFARSLPDVHYETLRKAAAAERPVAPKVVEAVAKELGVEPATFADYRLWEVRKTFDPGSVGIDAALENLARWEGELESGDR
ncbi:MAG TPA: hypothetical protein VK488_06955 [Gaiellaceae bacterium]|nr:hypothetical protein [Gaiellaceae bacterium]